MFFLNQGKDPRKQDSWQYGWDLGLALIMPHMRRRRNSSGLNKYLLSTIDSVLVPADDQAPGDQADDVPAVLPAALQVQVDQPGAVQVGVGHADAGQVQAGDGQGHAGDQALHSIEGLRRRCAVCVAELDTLGHKKEKNKLSKQLTQCQVCCRALCKQHKVQTCEVCAGPRQDGGQAGDEDGVND